MKRPNLVFVFADQWRAQAFGYAGDPNAKTPNIDRFSETSVNFRNAVSGCPVCCAYRASLMTGQRPLTHGVFLNDVKPKISGPTFAESLASGGYDTAYIGKWHAGGGPRLEHTPEKFRTGFKFWRGIECTHDYNNSIYYTESGERRLWDGYDAQAQTKEAISFLKSREKENPFALFLSWAPPHDPYDSAPAQFRILFDENNIVLRPNVPSEFQAETRRELAGYYAHGSALDACFGELIECLDSLGLADDTIVVFTSDHGDMLRSQGMSNKQRPWDESIRVPFLLRWPAGGCGDAIRDELIDAPDIMPSMLSLCGLEIPASVEGKDLSNAFLGGAKDDEAALLLNVYAFHQCFGWDKAEWRAVRTARHTFAITHDGPWLLYDNFNDPFQLDNLETTSEAVELQADMEKLLLRLLKERNDKFLSGREYVELFGHVLDEKGDVPYSDWNKERSEIGDKT